MKSRNKDGVVKEQTGKRDLSLHNRHRLWGYDVPALDIDFLEYANGKAVALIEAKSGNKKMSKYNEKALVDLADRAKLPCFLVHYTNDLSRYKVKPLNTFAENSLGNFLPSNSDHWLGNTGETTFNQMKYVEFLYYLRKDKMPRNIRERIENNDWDENEAQMVDSV